MGSEKAPVLKTKTVNGLIDTLIPGNTFAGRYEVLEEIGRGGMGIVFKAEDTKLKRTVAIKSISPLLLTGEEEKIRFFREAQAAAALNHPNICTVYEIDELEGHPFIAMEYIEGQNLRSKIEARPLKLEDAIDIIIQVVEGLRHAHKNGIIHRDVKSANIMVKKDNHVKIMDFGLAKLIGSSQITQQGTTIGTIAYMSPEQAKGNTADSRSDIWSLGVVIYEGISGQLPFQGEYDQALVYSILNDDPQALTALRSGVPLELERILNKCLEKEPEYRYQSTSDLQADLKRLKRDLGTLETSAPSSATITPSQKSKISVPIMITSSVAAMIILFFALYFLFLKPRASPVLPLTGLRLVPFTGGDGLCSFPDWSSDGTWLVYASDESGNLDIWKKPVDGGESIQLTASPFNESHPAWSPDGKRIAFHSDREGGGVFLIPSEGGTPWRVTSFGAHPAWSPDNETLAFEWHGNIYLVPYSGGDPRMIVSGTSTTTYAIWTPDGERLIFWDRTKGDVYYYSVKEGIAESLKLVPSGKEVSGLALSKEGRELVLSLGPFGGDKDLWRVEIDPKTMKTIGSLSHFSVTTTEDIQCAFSPDGSKFAFSVCQLERHLWAFPLDSATGLIIGKPERLTFKSKLNYYPAISIDGRNLVWTSHITSQGVLAMLNFEEREEKKVTREWGEKAREVGASFSPDGRQVCYSSTIGSSYEIWRLPSLGSVALQLTKTEGRYRDTLTSWSPDGGTVAFYSNRSGNWDIWSVPSDGRGNPKQLTDWDSNENYLSWSPDGRKITFRTDREGNGDIWIMDADGDNLKPFVTHPADEGWSAWSPDGRWFYFISNRDSGFYNVWIKSDNGDSEQQVTTYKGTSPGLPDFVLFTKFVVSSSHLIVPLETRKGNIYILDNLK
jgi:serine/threonine protein kinase/sugar lactone lactonase YvrE